MSHQNDSLERLQGQIREMPLAERLERVTDIVSEMCKEGRPPKMSIPVQAKDEDIFITTTIQDVMSILAARH